MNYVLWAFFSCMVISGIWVGIALEKRRSRYQERMRQRTARIKAMIAPSPGAPDYVAIVRALQRLTPPGTEYHWGEHVFIMPDGTRISREWAIDRPQSVHRDYWNLPGQPANPIRPGEEQSAALPAIKHEPPPMPACRPARRMIFRGEQNG